VTVIVPVPLPAGMVTLVGESVKTQGGSWARQDPAVASRITGAIAPFTPQNRRMVGL